MDEGGQLKRNEIRKERMREINKRRNNKADFEFKAKRILKIHFGESYWSL